LWASEPGVTHDGCGIGGNIANDGFYYGVESPSIGRGSLVRFYQGTTQFRSLPAAQGNGSTGYETFNIDIDGNCAARGSIKLGDDTKAAATAGAGTMRYRNNQLQISDGSNWVAVYEPPNDGTSTHPFASAWESKQLGYSNGNYYVMINTTMHHVYINNSDYDGAWILVTRARNNSYGHFGSGGSGGDTTPISPTGEIRDYSDSLINQIFSSRAYAGSNSGCTWRAYANNRGHMFGYATSANFNSDGEANGSGWDLVNGSYSSSYNVNLAGNDGSRGFGDHHNNGSFYAYNRHNANAGFAHDNMSN
jgi:hypothetical protein